MTNKLYKIYKVNIKRLALLTLPTWLRRPLVGGLIYAGVSPLGRLLQDLRAYRSAISYRLRHNGQVCKLRGALNDEFDPELRRIKIEDSSTMKESSVVYVREEAKWVMMPQRKYSSVIIHRRGFSGTSGYDFWVTAPLHIYSEQTETRMRAVVNNYKLASKRFTINFI